MRIDRSHRHWFVFSIVVLLVSGTWWWFARQQGDAALNGLSGGSAAGLTFGIVGSLFMLFAGLLGMRRRFRTWRIGSAQFWMRGHLWLGALALPLIWFHGDFRHGGLLTTVLMWLTYVIVVSGIAGAIIQHLVPRAMTQSVKSEVTYDQIPVVLSHLADEAEDVAAVAGPANGEDLTKWRERMTARIKARDSRTLLTAERRDRMLASVASAPAEGSTPLKELYTTEVRPFLSSGGESTGTMLVADPNRAAAVFAQTRAIIPGALHEPLSDLERICDDVRQLRQQRTMHFWLHSWLLVHVPLCMALLLLGVIHAVAALGYSL